MNSYRILLGCSMMILFISSPLRAATLASQLMTASQIINRKCPIMVNKDLRADFTAAAGNEFIYLYTLVNESSSKLPEDMITALREQVRKGLCSDTSLAEFSKKGVKFSYMYRNYRGTFVAGIEIPAYECKND